MSLQIRNLKVSVAGKSVLSGITTDFELGKTTFVIGKNGSGKSSLALAIMGHPAYRTEGDILLDGDSIVGKNATQRAHLGIFLALQNIPEIPGIKLAEFLRTIYNEHIKRIQPETKPLTPFVFRRFVTPLMQKLGLSADFLDRDLNVGFSGGEKRRLEMLQIELLSPKYIIVDEIDSGLDIEAFRFVTESLKRALTPERSLVVITHNYRFAETVRPDRVIVLESGKITLDGGAEILKQVEESGFLVTA